MLRLYHDKFQFHWKNHPTIFKLFRVLNPIHYHQFGFIMMQNTTQWTKLKNFFRIFLLLCVLCFTFAKDLRDILIVYPNNLFSTK